MDERVKEVYHAYDRIRKTADAAAADLFDLEEMRALEEEVGKRG